MSTCLDVSLSPPRSARLVRKFQLTKPINASAININSLTPPALLEGRSPLYECSLLFNGKFTRSAEYGSACAIDCKASLHSLNLALHVQGYKTVRLCLSALEVIRSKTVSSLSFLLPTVCNSNESYR
jgi:hypothetical protein